MNLLKMFGLPWCSPKTAPRGPGMTVSALQQLDNLDVSSLRVLVLGGPTFPALSARREYMRSYMEIGSDELVPGTDHNNLSYRFISVHLKDYLWLPSATMSRDYCNEPYDLVVLNADSQSFTPALKVALDVTSDGGLLIVNNSDLFPEQIVNTCSVHGCFHVDFHGTTENSNVERVTSFISHNPSWFDRIELKRRVIAGY